MAEHYYGQIVGVDIYKNDVVVRRQALTHKPPEVTRGVVREFSKKSRRRLAFVVSNTDVPLRTLITLTYPAEYPSDGPTVKGHLRKFLTWLQKETGGCEYIWFLEFQARGAPHFHILTDWPLPRDRGNKVLWYAKIGQQWYEIVDSKDFKHRLAGTRTETLRSPEGGAHYCVKYAQKMKQKIVPEGYLGVGRFWGHTKAVKPEVKSSHRATEDDVRSMLEGWKYEPPPDLPIWRVLYNQASWFTDWINGLVDNRPNDRYNGAKPHPVTAPSKAQMDKGQNSDSEV